MNKYLVAFDIKTELDSILWKVLELKNQVAFDDRNTLWLADSDLEIDDIIVKVKRRNEANPINECILIQNLETRDFVFYNEPLEWKNWLAERNIDLSNPNWK